MFVALTSTFECLRTRLKSSYDPSTHRACKRFWKINQCHSKATIISCEKAHGLAKVIFVPKQISCTNWSHIFTRAYVEKACSDSTDIHASKPFGVSPWARVACLPTSAFLDWFIFPECWMLIWPIWKSELARTNGREISHVKQRRNNPKKTSWNIALHRW